MKDQSSANLDYRLLFESAPGLFLVLDGDLRIVAASDAYLRATMTMREKIVGHGIFEIFPDNPDDASADGVNNLRNSLQRVLKTCKPDTMAVQKYDIRRDGPEGGFEVRYWSPVNTPVPGPDGNVLYIIHRVEDVTEFVKVKLKETEQNEIAERLLQKTGEMEAEIYRRAQELQEANGRLRSANEALEEKEKALHELDKLKDEFFANVSHELRTPLTLILAPVEALLESPGTDALPEIKTNLKTVRNNGLRLLHLVNSLLDFSKLNEGKLSVDRQATNLAELTKSMVTDFLPLMRSKGITGKFRIDPVTAESLTVDMDRTLYEKILFNLLSNAVKFTGEGGDIDVCLALQDGKAEISVSDTGIGIAEKDAERLFQRFKQVEGSTTRRFEGSGLGLALAREFAVLLGGTVSLQSEVGKGSTFRVSLSAPLSDTDAAESEPAATAYAGMIATPSGPAPEALPVVANAGPADNTKPFVIVAEDNIEMAGLIAQVISPSCVVELCADGEKALQSIRKNRPALVISDAMMPRMDGIELTRAIRADIELSAIPVILLTALTSRDALLRGWDAGVDEYLFKPFHPRELEARIRSLLAIVSWREKSETQRKKRETLEQFSTIASHDLKEPLRKIAIFAGLLRSRYAGTLDERAQKQLEIIMNDAARMHTTLESLIHYSRIDPTRERWELVDMHRVASEVVESLNGLFEEVDAQISIGNLPEIRGIPVFMASLFTNLITNSLCYRDPERRLRIEIAAEAKGREWEFSITDNGIGFDSHFRDDIFIMFKRLHSRQQHPGDGMGLAICKKIVENHGGRIWAEGVPDEGARFYFRLPADPIA